ncbi:hypothetical protein [Halomarina rubra]|uniref:Uncharacterized protein n=1 Tax=Halomarina rubra TaxID=2071873 RepID=A0ABD6AZU6_9EURY|nr:hypothetical protein [Halomarina rubra]
MKLLSADNLLVAGLFGLLAFVVVNDVRRPGYHPTWQLYVALLGAMLVVMGYSVDSQWVTIGTASQEDDSS